LIGFLLQETRQENLAEPLHQAALHCKNDLVTRMVREFPSLQGIMGGLYLKEKDAEEETWRAVYGHYEPKCFHSATLQHTGTALLSMADKVDNIAAFLSKGIKISSSKDPYGVRRDANGIIKIIIDLKLDFNLENLIMEAALKFTGGEKNEAAMKIAKQVKALFVSRLENIFKDFLKIRYDVVNAVVNADGLFIYNMYLRALDVSKIVKTDNIEHLVALHKRLKNIAKKSEQYNVSPDALIEDEEKLLFDIFTESKSKIENSLLNHQYLQACSEILEMKPVIDNFFDKVLVNAKEEKLRQNRIALVQRLDQLLSKIADFSLIVD
jgi:glycyl-tRNA synthetase beta chain